LFLTHHAPVLSTRGFRAQPNDVFC
jgi:hypothetical protein